MASLQALEAAPLYRTCVGSAEALFAKQSRQGDALPLGKFSLDSILIDGGLPTGVTELASPWGLGGSTRVAFEAVRTAQARDPRSWCAWIDPERTIYGPGLAQMGVDLTRLLVVRVTRTALPRAAVKMTRSGAFAVIIVDMHAIDGSCLLETNANRFSTNAMGHSKRQGNQPETVVRKLVLAAKDEGIRVLLLTDMNVRRTLPWPVNLRLELTRPSTDSLTFKIAHDQRGRVGLSQTVAFSSWTP